MIDGPIPRIVGHRGACAVEPENTLTSFARGVADGADQIELDVHLSADGVVVVHHDPTVDRTAVGSGRTTGAIADLTWAQLQEVELGGGQRIPTIEQALDAIAVPVLIEIKALEAAGPVARLVAEGGYAQQSIFISFKPEALAEVLRVDPGYRTGLIASGTTDVQRAALAELGCQNYSLRYDGLTREEAAHWQATGVTVTGWPTLTDADLAAGLAAGVDFLTADDPGWARRAVEAALAARPAG
ncbi:glycerophosphodiester phosphodiesterase [Occultella glacieicola]|uniref:Glycerophosphodiester phosphodiesterase n=1 Tax=Occultella glacieicola TaxID=2518684 RepID=A0ABY2DY94_9MICO|nr:glycerophosphodiester phosphodiesterase [Occultella glacieicola]TDE88570.1 glycerophosphodiester phosphodiesterase [Occultella glacieicola]